MSRFDNIIQVPGLAAPKLIEPLSYQTLLDRQLAAYAHLWPEFDDETEFEPVRAHLGVDAYVENALRQRINEAAQATRLATAEGADLDIIGMSRRRNVERLEIDPGDPAATPPVDPVYEEDEDYRKRIQLSPESYSVAGPEGAYVYWALSVAGVADATAISPEPCDALITILARAGDGSAGPDLISDVEAALNDKTRRPIGDRVTVVGAEILPRVLDVTLYVPPGTVDDAVVGPATEALQAYLDDVFMIGVSPDISSMHAALKVSGVSRVRVLIDGALTETGIAVGDGQAAHVAINSLVTEVDGV